MLSNFLRVVVASSALLAGVASADEPAIVEEILVVEEAIAVADLQRPAAPAADKVVLEDLTSRLERPTPLGS